MGAMSPALALLALAHLLGSAAALKIGAFNIRAFGDKKLSDEITAGIIVKILSWYDIILLQEVRDADLSAVNNLLEQLNRTLSVSVEATYQYPDPNDTFSREPFIVKFSSPYSKVREFVLVPLHTPPKEAVAEIDALYNVHRAVINKWGTDNIIFLGDFNADCSYVRKGDWESIRLRTSEVFEWLIPDTMDTTVGKSDCAYDRIVVCGPKLKKSIVPKSAAVYNFQRVFKLDEDEALAVSDHFPVEVTLKAP